MQPTGLVVSAPALVRAGAILDRHDSEGQTLLRECTEERTFDVKQGPAHGSRTSACLQGSVLGWSSHQRATLELKSPIPTELELPLPDYGETLRPDFAVRELDLRTAARPGSSSCACSNPGWT